MPITCDLFCRVVDNFGDAGVCWRLARQLAHEYDWAIRLWIDDPIPLAGLRPGIDPSLPAQLVDGVEIRHWIPEFPDLAPGDVVIEAFGCELPGSFVSSMAGRDRQPVWINLEYLSAESWVPGCHGLPSPHPSLPLTKYFFFPGFVPGTGGLIRERNLAAAPPRKPTGDLIVSLFCYETPSLPALLESWAKGDERVTCRLADGLPRQQVARWLARDILPGDSITFGNLTLNALPFVPQAEFDQLLVESDLNLVRGEDSFVRAQWAERPFVWQAYPQSGDAHLGKVDAFLECYLATVAPAWRAATADFFRAWNGAGDVAATWAPFRNALPALGSAARPWAERIASHGNLAENLVRFCRERL